MKKEGENLSVYNKKEIKFKLLAVAVIVALVVPMVMIPVGVVQAGKKISIEEEVILGEINKFLNEKYLGIKVLESKAFAEIVDIAVIETDRGVVKAVEADSVMKYNAARCHYEGKAIEIKVNLKLSNGIELEAEGMPGSIVIGVSGGEKVVKKDEKTLKMLDEIENKLVEAIEKAAIYPKGLYIFDGAIDPNLIYINELVSMCEKFKIAYTEKEAVINKVNRYRIDKGWITIMLIHPSIEITYDALFIANELEFDKYNREKIKNYAVSYVENPPKDFKKFYYALKVLQ